MDYDKEMEIELVIRGGRKIQPEIKEQLLNTIMEKFPCVVCCHTTTLN